MSFTLAAGAQESANVNKKIIDPAIIIVRSVLSSSPLLFLRATEKFLLRKPDEKF